MRKPDGLIFSGNCFDFSEWWPDESRSGFFSAVMNAREGAAGLG
jgi:hypothetical protein